MLSVTGRCIVQTLTLITLFSGKMKYQLLRQKYDFLYFPWKIKCDTVTQKSLNISQYILSPGLKIPFDGGFQHNRVSLSGMVSSFTDRVYLKYLLENNAFKLVKRYILFWDLFYFRLFTVMTDGPKSKMALHIPFQDHL